MNPSNLRRLARALVIALHGVATLCGPAMHLHGLGVRAARDEGKTFASRVGHSHAECPVCRFLNEGRHGVDRNGLRRIEVFATDVLIVDVLERSPRFTCGQRPRGPPQL